MSTYACYQIESFRNYKISSLKIHPITKYRFKNKDNNPYKQQELIPLMTSKFGSNNCLLVASAILLGYD